MDYYSLIPGILSIIFALLILFRLMHYAPFYAPSYFFWTGVVIAIIAAISLFHPLTFLFIPNRTIAVFVLTGGILMSVISLLVPVKQYHSETHLAIDTLLPDYSFNEYHEITINAPVEKVKQALQTTGVKDIPVIWLLMKIRGIADDNKDMSNKVTHNQQDSGSFSTPDFNFIVDSPAEFYTLMILKSSAKISPPEVATAKEFQAFNEPGYIKVAINFRFVALNARQTLVSTETRNFSSTKKDCRIFGCYWRVIYPGSAIIRRLWLDTMAKQAKKVYDN